MLSWEWLLSLELCAFCLKGLPLGQKLCIQCLSRFDTYRNFPGRIFGEYRSFSLYSWGENSPGFSHFVYQVKGRRSRRLLALMATQMCFQFARGYGGSFEDLASKKLGFAFVPSTRYGFKSHGFFLALECSRILRGPLIFLPKTQGSRAQKGKSRGERFQLHLKNSIYSPLVKLDAIIFVDDVITSGATARAVYWALGRPKGFQVWTLFDRFKTPLIPERAMI